MRPSLSCLPIALFLLPACGDDVSGNDTDASSTGSTTEPSTSGVSTSTSSSSGDAESTSSSGTGSDTSSSGVADVSTSSGDTETSTGASVLCTDEPVAPDQGTYRSMCAGAAPGETCALSCANGRTPTGEAECQNDGTWSSPGCEDPFDQDEDGLRRYPWGADLDDDGDGAFTYLLGGDDYDDTDPAVQGLAGDGTFSLGEVYPLGMSAAPTGLAIGDWDNDGNVDLATTNQNNDTMSVFVGAGDGTFTPSQTIELPTEAGGGRVKPVDLDGDGNLDLVATFGCRVFEGAGDGTFADSGTALGSCNYLHVFDANDDDRLDVMSFTYGATGQLRAFLAQDDGSFVSADTPAPNISVFAPGFIDGDATMDIGLVEFTNRSAQTFLGVGDGTFVLTDTMDDAFLYNAIAIARDLDGDDFADLLIGDFINNHIGLVSGDGTGQLAASAPIVVSGPAADGLFTGDLDSDGNADIVFAAQAAGFGVALGSGSGSFAAATNYDLGSGEFGLEGADFNGDGRMDFAVINISSDDLAIVLGN